MVEHTLSSINLTTMTQNRRYLTSHERWFLMRRNTGHQFTITVLVSYTNSASLPSVTQLESRMAELQSHFSQLRCRLRDVKTRKPYWEEDSVCEIVNHCEYMDTREEDVLMEEQKRMEMEDFDDGRYWQVTLYESPSNKAYIAVSALHALIDGRGLLRLVHALLVDDISCLPFETLSTVATYPDTIDIRPTWAFLLSFAVQEKIYPWLPRFITSYLTDSVWPMGRVHSNPLWLPSRTILLDIPSELVDLLKSVGRFHGVPTLTPTLFTAWLVAMWTATGSALSASIAVDERRAELGHSYCTGLYHASHFYSIQFPTPSFWSAARGVALHIAHPSSLSIARMRMGMTAWVPDGDVPESRRDDVRRPTAWEDWQLQRNENLQPYLSSASFSNLGKVDIPAGAESIVTASSASIGDPPLKLVLVGSADRVRVAVTFREGDILQESQVREMGELWMMILRRLVSGRGEDLQLDSVAVLSRECTSATSY